MSVDRKQTELMTADLSLYPLRDGYIPVIDDFIEALKADEQLTVRVSELSTRLSGPWDSVMSAVDATLKRSVERFGEQVLVVKFIGGVDLLND